MANNDSTYEITEAPDVVDLDALLSMEDTDLGSSTEDVDLSNYGEPEEAIEYPHFKVNTKKFIEALKISNIVSQGAGRDVVSKAVGMEVKGGELQVYLTDFEIFVEKSIDIINTENVLFDFVSVNLSIIAKLVKACSSTVTIFKKDEKYFIRLIGGDMELETISVNKSQLLLKDKDKFAKAGDLVTGDFYKVIRNLFVLANAAVTPHQRKIFFKDNKIMSVFLFSLAEYRATKNVPEMDLKIKDIKILYSLSMACEDTELTVSKFNNRVMVTGSNFMYSFLLTDSKPPQQMIDSMDTVFANDPIYVDCSQLIKLTDVSSDLMYSTSRMDFNYTDDGQVECILRTKRSDANFNLRGTPNTELKPLKKHISVQSSLLKVLLKVFSQDSTIGFVISEQGIGLVNNNYRGVLFTEAE